LVIRLLLLDPSFSLTMRMRTMRMRTMRMMMRMKMTMMTKMKMKIRQRASAYEIPRMTTLCSLKGMLTESAIETVKTTMTKETKTKTKMTTARARARAKKLGTRVHGQMLRHHCLKARVEPETHRVHPHLQGVGEAGAMSGRKKMKTTLRPS